MSDEDRNGCDKIAWLHCRRARERVCGVEGRVNMYCLQVDIAVEAQAIDASQDARALRGAEGYPPSL